MAKSKESGPKPRNDAYTGLLAISFLALVGATVLMAMDASDLGTPPAATNINAPGTKTGTSAEFKRQDTNNIDTSPNVPRTAPDKDKDKEDSKTPEAPKGAPEAPKGGVAPKKDTPKGEDSLSAKPREIDLPAVVVPAPVIQVGGTEPALEIEAPKALPKTLDPQDPPLNVKPFIPPM
jgi:hypothetical protein